MPDADVQKLAEALAVILKGDQSPPPETPAAPAAPVAPAGAPADAPAPAPQAVPPAEFVEAVAQRSAGPQPPPGRAPLTSLDQWEALPEKEQLARMDEVDQLLREGES
jgi:hypothetical protein